MSSDRGRGAALGRGRGNAAVSEMRDAANVRAPRAVGIYSNENRDRVHAQVRETRPALDAALNLDDPDNQEYLDAQDQAWDLAAAILRKEYEALSSSAKEFYEQQERENQANAWRRMRSQGRLIENEASLRQKADDDALIAAGAPVDQFNGNGRGRGGGGRGR